MNDLFHSRRQFLRGAAAFSLAGIVSPSSLLGSDLLQGKKKLGVALVGLGDYSKVILAKALGEAERCYLAGVVSGTHHGPATTASGLMLRKNKDLASLLTDCVEKLGKTPAVVGLTMLF